MSTFHTEIPVDGSNHQPYPHVPPARRLSKGTRYYAHRVRESLTTRVSKFLCSCLLGLLLILGLVAFILWLSLRPHRPRFYVNAFSASGLNAENGFQNALITFNASFRNPNQNVGIYYDAVDGTVYYRDQRIGVTPLMLPFYQPPKTTTVVNGTLAGASLLVANESWRQYVANGTLGFRLELTSSIRFKVARWVNRRHRMDASCDVTVGADGQILDASKGKRCSFYFY
ncbi:hypothetical protein ACLOJK_029359 [Asimina triloba]